MSTAQPLKFTDAQTAYVVETYRASPTDETVAALALELQRSTNSIVGKLVSEKVYIPKTTKATGPKRLTKAKMLSLTEDALGLDEGTLASLDKGSLDSIQALWHAVRGQKDPSAWLSEQTE